MITNMMKILVRRKILLSHSILALGAAVALVRALKDLLYSGANISQTTSDTKKWNALHFAAKFNKRNTNTVNFAESSRYIGL